jgi:hypothetical protein
MPKVSVSVSVDNAYVDQILTVVESLQAMGMEVEQTLPSIGVISGSIDVDRVNCLHQVAGVQHIELAQGYQLPSPDADVQ